MDKFKQLFGEDASENTGAVDTVHCQLHGGAESQVRGHTQDNKNVGNVKETLVAAVTHCLHYIGFYNAELARKH